MSVVFLCCFAGIEDFLDCCCCLLVMAAGFSYFFCIFDRGFSFLFVTLFFIAGAPFLCDTASSAHVSEVI